jgi:hypothetical protein
MRVLGAEHLASSRAARRALRRLRVRVSLEPRRARARSRLAGPGLLVGSAWGGDGEAALERADAEADEPLFHFLMLRVAATDEEDEAGGE